MTNCLLWAYAMRRRRRARGVRCYVATRRSDWGPFPHWLYIEERPGGLRILSYKPLSPKKRLLPPPLFSGKVVWGDPKPPSDR